MHKITHSTCNNISPLGSSCQILPPTSKWGSALSATSPQFMIEPKPYAHAGEVHIAVPCGSLLVLCGIIGLNWSMWALTVKGLSFDLCWFLTLTPFYQSSPVRESLAPNFDFTRLPFTLEGVDVILTDAGTVSHGAFRWNAIACHVVVVCGQIRHNFVHTQITH